MLLYLALRYWLGWQVLINRRVIARLSMVSRPEYFLPQLWHCCLLRDCRDVLDFKFASALAATPKFSYHRFPFKWYNLIQSLQVVLLNRRLLLKPSLRPRQWFVYFFAVPWNKVGTPCMLYRMQRGQLNFFCLRHERHQVIHFAKCFRCYQFNESLKVGWTIRLGMVINVSQEFHFPLC